MTDPLSITFGVIGTAAIALRSVQQLKAFVESIEGAPSAINSLTADLSALDNVLQTLEATVTDSTISNVDTRARILKLVNDPLQNCIRVVDLTSAKLTPFVKVGTKAKKSKWKGFIWTYREKEFTDLKTLLLSYKSSLEIALSAANLTNNVAGFSDLQIRIKKLQRRIDVDNASIADSSLDGWSTTQTEYNFALKRFLLDTESVCGDAADTFSEQAWADSSKDDLLHRPYVSLPEPSKILPFPQAEETLAELSAEPLEVFRSSQPEGSLVKLSAESASLPRSLQPEGSIAELSAENDVQKSSTESRLRQVSPEEREVSQKDACTERWLPCTEGCIIPDLVATVESQEGFDNVFRLNRASKAPSHDVYDKSNSREIAPQHSFSITGSLHLFGFQASWLTSSGSKRASSFDEALYDFQAKEPMQLSFKRGDIIRRKRDDLLDDSLVGYLGTSLGRYPRDYVRPCVFSFDIAWQVIDALLNRALLNEATSNLFFDASGIRDEGLRPISFQNYVQNVPTPGRLLLFLIRNMRRIYDEGRTLPSTQPSGVQLEKWSQIILSDIDRETTESATTSNWKSKVFQMLSPWEVEPATKLHWKSEVLEFMFEQLELMEISSKSPISTKLTSTTRASHLKLNLRSLCSHENKAVPMLVVKTIKTIQVNLVRKPIYTSISEIEIQRQFAALSQKHLSERDLYIALYEAVARIEDNSASFLLFFFGFLDRAIFGIESPLNPKILLQERISALDEWSYMTLKVLFQHLRRVSEYRAANGHSLFYLARIWTPALTGEYSQNSAREDLVLKLLERTDLI